MSGSIATSSCGNLVSSERSLLPIVRAHAMLMSTRARLRIMIDRTTTEPTSVLERLILDGSIAAEMIEPGVPTPTVPEAAIALGVDQRQIIKSLLFASKRGEVVLAVLSGAA